MTDLSTTIEPKSDQLNADDLIAGPIVIKVTKVSDNLSAPDQPISVHFEGDGGKPYKPCKSMRRVLVHSWGADGSKYPGRSMRLYLDPRVKFGGIEVGGIRISHLTDIAEPITMALTAARASRKPFTVKPFPPKAAAASKPVEQEKPAPEQVPVDPDPPARGLPEAKAEEPVDPDCPRGVAVDTWRQACSFARDGREALHNFVQTISDEDYKGIAANAEVLYALFPKGAAP